MPRTRFALMPVLAVAGSLAVGCGGSVTTTKSSSATATRTTAQPAASAPVQSGGPAGKPLTKTQLVAQANTICATLNAHVGSVHTTTLSTVGATAPQIVRYYRIASDALRKLIPPAALAADWNAAVADIDAIAGEVAKMGKYAKDNDVQSTVGVENQIAAVQFRRFAIAKRYGIHSCAEI